MLMEIVENFKIIINLSLFNEKIETLYKCRDINEEEKLNIAEENMKK